MGPTHQLFEIKVQCIHNLSAPLGLLLLLSIFAFATVGKINFPDLYVAPNSKEVKLQRSLLKPLFSLNYIFFKRITRAWGNRSIDFVFHDPGNKKKRTIIKGE